MKQVVVLVLGSFCLVLAHAGLVFCQFQNRTALSFEYSLQLAHVRGGSATARTFLGAYDTDQLQPLPDFRPGAQSLDRSYVIARGMKRDGVAFNMLTTTGEKFGLSRAQSVHDCALRAGWDGKRVVFVLQPAGGGGKGLELVEWLPDGSHCSFELEPGYGPSLWMGYRRPTLNLARLGIHGG